MFDDDPWSNFVLYCWVASDETFARPHSRQGSEGFKQGKEYHYRLTRLTTTVCRATFFCPSSVTRMNRRSKRCHFFFFLMIFDWKMKRKKRRKKSILSFRWRKIDIDFDHSFTNYSYLSLKLKDNIFFVIVHL